MGTKKLTKALRICAASLALAAGGSASAGEELAWGSSDGNFSAPSSWTSSGDLTGYTSIYDWQSDSLGKNIRFASSSAGCTVTMDIWDNRVWNCWVENGVSPVVFNAGDSSKGFEAFWGLHLANEANKNASLTVKNGAYTTPASDVDNGSNWGTGDNAKVALNLEGGKIDLWGATGTTSLSLTSGNGVESTINITGGTLAVSGGDLVIGSGDETSTTTINISNGGELSVGTSTTQKWLKPGVGGTSKTYINVNEGGTLAFWFITHLSTGETKLKVNSGTLKLLGATDHPNGALDTYQNDTFDVTIEAGGGTLDTNGKAITISKVISGTGTLRIIGGGSVNFTAAPTVPTIKLDSGTIVLPNGYAGTVTTDAVGYSVSPVAGDTTTTYSLTRAPSTFIWTGATSTSWSEPTNWEGGEVPTSIDDVEFPDGATVMIDSAVTISGATGKGTLSITGSNTLAVNGNVEVVGVLSISDTTLDASGFTIDAEGLTLNASLIEGNNNALPKQTKVIANNVNAPVSGSGIIIANGNVSISNSGTFAGNITAGELVKADGGSMTIYGVNSVNGEVRIAGGTLILGQPCNQGTINYDFDFSKQSAGEFSSVSDSNGGSITLSSANSSATAMIGTTESFGTKNVVYSSGLALTDSSHVNPVTTFMVWKRNNTTVTSDWSTYPMRDNNTSGSGHKNSYVTHYQGKVANSYSIRVSGSTWATSDTVSINGVPSSKDFYSKQVLTVSGNGWIYGSEKARYGGGIDCEIGEILSYSNKFTLDARRAVEDYLMAKWGIGNLEYEVLSKTANVAIAGGGILDLGGLSQTIASLSVSGTGTATVQNGSLTVTAPISLSNGQVLLLPANTTYTLANPSSVNVSVDSETGVITLSRGAASVGDTFYGTAQEAIDALLAGEATGTLTIFQSATIDLSTTARTISNVVLNSDATLTFTANLPWQGSYDATTGTIENKRVASTFIWTPKNDSTDWDALDNWKIGGVVATALPGADDAVAFYENAALNLSKEYSIRALVVASGKKVTIKGGGLVEIHEFGTETDKGGTVALINSELRSYDISNSEVSWYGDIEIAGGDTATSYIRARISTMGASGTLKLYGNLSGNGSLVLHVIGHNTNGQPDGQGGVSLYGDNHEYKGTCTIKRGGAGYNRGPATFCSGMAGSPNARWIYPDSVEAHTGARVGTINVSGETIQLGTYEGSSYILGCTSHTDNTIEIGDADINFSCSLSARSSTAERANNNATLKKVGKGTMTLGNALGNPCFNTYEMNGGILLFANNEILRSATGQNKYTNPVYKFTGGTIAFDPDVCVDENGDLIDISPYIQDSTSAISVSNDVALSWKTELKSSNVGDLIKKGSGTLTIVSPAMDMEISVEGGAVKVLSSDTRCRAADGTVKTTDEGYYVFMKQPTIEPGAMPKVTAADQAAADAIAAQYVVTPTEEQKEAGVTADYYKVVAKETETAGTYSLEVKFADKVVPEVSKETVSENAVTFTVSNYKKGLYYGVATGASADAVSAGTLTQCEDEAQGVTLTADLPDSGVQYYQIVVSDTATAQ